MSGPHVEQPEPVSDVRQLVAYHEAGCKPAQRWRIGTEHEKFVFRLGDLRPAPYGGPWGIRALLEGLQRYGWRPLLEEGRPVALSRGACSITLEPSGQLEFSGEPLENLHQSCAEMGEHLRQVKGVAEGLGVSLVGLGFEPMWGRTVMPWMPKARYELMRAYLPRRGERALDMMLRTCAIQVNLDYAGEADMVTKYRVGLALQPLATALFANSPFRDGAPSGYLSYRAAVWRRTDPDRCGFPAFVFEPGMGFERFVEAALDVPMFFVYREGRYIDASGCSFRDFLRGRLPVLPGERPTVGDWADHLTTLFHEVRMKRFLEMRGADGGPWTRLCALPAFWVGLLYDSRSLSAAAELTRGWGARQVDALHERVAREALGATIAGRPLRDWAREILTLARTGLVRRGRKDGRGRDESCYLEVLEESLERGRTPAEELLQAYAGRWRRRIEPLYREYAY